MNKLIFTAVATVFFAINTAYAQLPIKSDKSELGATPHDVLNTAPKPSLANAATVVASESQVGALNECYSAMGNQPRTALRLCLDRKAQEAKLQMKTAYKKLEADTRRIDSSSTAKALSSLHASQRAFEGFKSAQCQWKFDSAMGGSGSGDFRNSCEIDMMRLRTLQLAN